MARIRSIKPEIRTSEKVNSWPIELRYFWVLLWGFCDDYGRGKDNARLIVADAFPLDDAVDVDTVSEWMSVLADAKVIARYEVGGGRYFYVTNWAEHQKVSHPSKSAIPGPEKVSGESRESLASVSGDLPFGGEGEQGAGSREGEASDDAEPSPFCNKHPKGTSEPCGACGDARMASKLWATRRRARPTVIPPRGPAVRECENHAGYPLPCDRCAAEAAERSAA